MHCEQAGPLLGDYREHLLGEAEQHELVQHLQQCEHCRADLETLDAMARDARHWRDVPVPDWHRTAFAVPTPPPRQWLPWLSMATSALCLLVLITGVDVQRDEHGVQIRLGAGGGRGEASAGVSAHQLEQRLSLLMEHQQIALANQLAAWDLGQQQDNRVLLQAVLEYARGQQRQDLAQWAGYWKTVRDNDQALQARALGELLASQRLSQRELRALKASFHTTLDEEAQ